jgi:hypothetical protein
VAYTEACILCVCVNPCLPRCSVLESSPSLEHKSLRNRPVPDNGVNTALASRLAPRGTALASRFAADRGTCIEGEGGLGSERSHTSSSESE